MKKSLTKAMQSMRSGHLRNYILPNFESMKIEDIDHVSIEDFLINLNLSNKTKNT